MARVSTSAGTKSKKTSRKPGDPVWEKDELLELNAKPLSDSLKRISEQAKDWEETRLPLVGAETVKQKVSYKINWSHWANVAAIVLLAFLTIQSAWLSWQASTLTKSLSRLDESVRQLKDKVEVWSDAETPAQMN